MYRTQEIKDLAEAAFYATEAISDLTGGNLMIIPLVDKANGHNLLVPQERHPETTRKAGPFDKEKGVRKVFQMVTNVVIDHKFASIWCRNDCKVSFRIEGERLIASIPQVKCRSGYDVEIGRVTKKIFESEGVVMDGAIYAEDWTEMVDVKWEDLEGVDEFALLMGAKG